MADENKGTAAVQVAAETTEQIMKWVDDQYKSGTFVDRWKLMDRDTDIFNMKPYVFKDTAGAPIKGVENVTSNEGRLYGKRVKSVLAAADPFPVVEGIDISQDKEFKIERFLKCASYYGDRQLALTFQPTFQTTQSDLICDRGWIGGRIIVWSMGTETKFDLTPVDMRNTVFRFGRGGLELVNVRGVKTQGIILKDYAITIREESAEVDECWTTDRMIARVKNYTAVETPHGFGKPPFVIKKVGTNGDSIYDAGRECLEEINKMQTILQTLNVLAFRPPLSFKSASGEDTLESYPYVIGLVQSLQLDEKVEVIPFTALRNEIQFMYNLKLAEWQRAALPFSEYGIMPNVETSALMLEKLKEGREQVFEPRVKAMGEMWIEVGQMLIEQFVNGGFTATVEDGKGKEITITAEDLSGKYLIGYTISTECPERNVVNYAVATSAKAVGISDYTIRRVILKLEDPIGEERKLNQEKIYGLVPAVFLMDTAQGLIDEAKNLTGEDKKRKEQKAQLILDELEQLQAMRQAATAPAPAGGAAGMGAPGAAVRPRQQMEAAPEQPNPQIIPDLTKTKTGQEKLNQRTLEQKGFQPMKPKEVRQMTRSSKGV